MLGSTTIAIPDPGILMVLEFSAEREMFPDLRVPDLESHLRAKDGHTFYVSPLSKNGHSIKRSLAFTRSRLHKEREAFFSSHITSRDE